ncbi:carbon-monoxide dehydrogenase small subunit [Haloechinothrix alba]|uniref:Carbon-monoxide dehydrogenase small subunit n=1 Tax=Haloechinothrix alba TaxID=664784 RepID=A0A238Y4I3_9PSEU|nr:(2Fe-2S)-binding protein [Haloechinothrix alba]SNR65573.1 carbon-monoxide dehydrogenase small subunit [Haloechinothrix alba]
MSDKHTITVTVNGHVYTDDCEARMTLADFLRRQCGLTGTHLGCEHGVCGACTVFLDDVAVRSCLTFAVQADGARISTVEGLAEGDELNTLQKSFQEHHGLQCGFCTPGMLICATELLRDNPNPTETEVREGISGVLCRCTGYDGIVKSVMAAADSQRDGVSESGSIS